MYIIGADSFIGTVGIRTALTYDGTPYTNTQAVLSSLQYLGIGTVRDGTPDPAQSTIAAYNQLADAGIKFDFVIPGNGAVQLPSDVANLHAFAVSHPGSISAIEGPNEVNFWPITYNARESRVRPNLGSGGEPERLHLIGVLSFDDEFREDVGCGGIQEKFRHALAQGIGHDQL
jgi:hypothetical protein